MKNLKICVLRGSAVPYPIPNTYNLVLNGA